MIMKQASNEALLAGFAYNFRIILELTEKS